MNPDKTINQNLIIACDKGNFPLVKKLIKLGAEVTCDDSYAVVAATCSNHFEILKYLVKNGANIRGQNDCAFIMTGSLGNLEIMKYIVSKAPTIFENNTDNIYEALYEASDQGHEHIIRYLLTKKINLFHDDCQALRRAARYNQREIVQMYISEFGMDIDIVIKEDKKQNARIMEWAKNYKKTIQLKNKLDSKLKEQPLDTPKKIKI